MRYINQHRELFSLVEGHDGQAAFEVVTSNARIIKKPEEVSAEVLKYLKRTASDYLGTDVTKAVISVPAYFSNAQRKATKRAAELAGFDVLKLITEPTAAAIHYVSDKHRNDSNILTIDFGGGTLDVSLIKINNRVFEVKAVYGDTLLGGRDFDEILFQHFHKDFLEKQNRDFLTSKFRRRLRNICVNLKKNLSTRENFTYFIDRYDGNTDLTVSMSRKKFEEMTNDILRRMMDVVDLCLEDSGLSKSEINEIVLVGGSTRIPKVRELLTSYFGPERIKTDLNPDEAVAAGAGLHAAFLLGNDRDLEKYKVTEVTPMSLGMKLSGNRMCVFIPRNSPLPIKASRVHVTSVNDQTRINIPVYEGERKNAKYNSKLGEFCITEIPKKPAGGVKVSIDFYLDEDGILSVSATEISTGKKNMMVVTMGQLRLSDRRIRSTLEDARKHKIEDDVFEKFILLKERIRIHCNRVLYDVKRISSETDQNFVKECCEKCLGGLKGLDVTEIGKLEEMFEEYIRSISDILKENSMLELTKLQLLHK